jgi:hypothetical protein
LRGPSESRFPISCYITREYQRIARTFLIYIIITTSGEMNMPMARCYEMHPD